MRCISYVRVLPTLYLQPVPSIPWDLDRNRYHALNPATPQRAINIEPRPWYHSSSSTIPQHATDINIETSIILPTPPIRRKPLILNLNTGNSHRNRGTVPPPPPILQRASDIEPQLRELASKQRYYYTFTLRSRTVTGSTPYISQGVMDIEH